MIVINIKNVEEKIFENNEVWNEIKDLKHLKDQWKLGKISPALRHMSRKSLLDFLNSIKSSHINILSSFFEEEVVVEKFDYHSIKNFSFSNKEEIANELNLMESKNELYSYFSTYKDKDQFHITFWR